MGTDELAEFQHADSNICLTVIDGMKRASSAMDTTSAFYRGDSGKAYYDKKFGRRMAMGREYQLRYFRPHCREDLDLLDFGCANGLSLRRLPARKRVGVEINPTAIEEARRLARCEELHVDYYLTLAEIGDESIDVAISNHCLEHVAAPCDVLRQLNRVLRAGGKLILVVPFDDWRLKKNRMWQPSDPDKHLFTWSPLNLGNLVNSAGFSEINCKCITSAWSPRFFWVKRYLGDWIFGVACFCYSMATNRREVVCIARKASS